MPTLVHDYMYNVVRSKKSFKKILTEPATKLYFGVELEAVIKDNCYYSEVAAACIKDLGTGAVLKEDSSIGDCFGGDEGFEIVTVPATLCFHKQQLWKKFFSVGHSYKYLKGWSEKTCGLHIHFSRASLTAIQQQRILYFYHAKANEKFLTKIAGREVGPRAEYCSTSPKTLVDSTPDKCTLRGSICLSYRNKDTTFEVRIFRSNISRYGVFRALEFVDATIKFVKSTKAKDSPENWEEYLDWIYFINWVSSPTNKIRYPNLTRYLNTLKYVPTTKAKKE